MTELLQGYDNFGKSLDTVTSTTKQLKELLSSRYMDVVVMKTVLDQQHVVQATIDLQSRLSNANASSERHHATIKHLRKEYEHVVDRLELAKQAHPPGTALSIRHSFLNSWFTIALFILTIVATFLAARLIISTTSE
jgi:hypothetical protein